MSDKIKSWFGFEARYTNLGTEICAGVTTFFSLLYMVIVVPTLFSRVGMDFGGAYLAVLLSMVTATLVMGIAANYPIAVAPAVGINSYLVYSVILSDGVPWQEALGTVCIASILYLILSLSSLRGMMRHVIPRSLRAAVGAGVGLLLALTGLENGRLLVSSPVTIISLGNLAEPMASLTVTGLFITLTLLVRGIFGAIFIGMILMAFMAYVQGIMEIPTTPFSLPYGINETFGQLAFNSPSVLGTVVFTLFLVTFFDTMGAMTAIVRQMDLADAEGDLRAGQVFLAMSVGSFFCAIAGAGPVAVAVESSIGVTAGGRTGFSAVVTAFMLGLLVFCAPLAKMISSVPAITAPALILSGGLMMGGIAEIDWGDYTEALPAFLTLLLLPLSFSIAIGIGCGFIFYVFLKIAAGKWRSVHPLMYALSVLFVGQMVFGLYGS